MSSSSPSSSAVSQESEADQHRSGSAGRTALVTGAARGIGLAIASRLARAGVSVFVADVDPMAAGDAARDLARDGATCWPLHLDVTNESMVAAAFAKIRQGPGRLDILVNNACRARYRFLLDMTPTDWADALAVCLTGTYLCSREAANLMRERGGGKIVNISSMAASVGLARTSAYAAAKGGVEALTRVLAVELAQFKIQVNAVAPGPVDTDFSRGTLAGEVRNERLRRLPAGRFGTPGEVAAAVTFLCSDDAQWITGATIRVDGGYTAAGSIEPWKPGEGGGPDA